MYNKIIKMASSFLLGACIMAAGAFSASAADITIPQGSTGNREYTANYSPTEYIITFDTDGGNEIKDKTYTIESGDFSLPTATKAGHTFLGWTGSNGKVPEKNVIIKSGSTGNKNYKANWEAGEYTYQIVYKSTTGKTLGTDSITAKYGSTVTITPIDIHGYTKPEKQSVLFDKVYEHTITFIYEPLEYNVTYHVDNGQVYTKKVKNEETVLNPVTFTPTKDGWKFKGWKTDKTADSNVLTECTVDGQDMELYAVFKKPVTMIFSSYSFVKLSTTNQEITETAFYNNGTIAEAAIKVPTPSDGYEEYGFTFRGWSNPNDVKADAAVFTVTDDIRTLEGGEIYALYERTNTLTYDGNEADSGYIEPVSGTEYRSASGNIIFPSIILPTEGFEKDKHLLSGWEIAGRTYDLGAKIDLQYSTTATAQWKNTKLRYEIVFKCEEGSGLKKYTLKQYTCDEDGEIIDLLTTYDGTFDKLYSDDYLSITWSDVINGRHTVKNLVDGTLTASGVYNKENGCIIPYINDNDCTVTFITKDFINIK